MTFIRSFWRRPRGREKADDEWTSARNRSPRHVTRTKIRRLTHSGSLLFALRYFFFQLFREKVSDWKEKRIIIQEGSSRREFRERVEEEEEEKDRMRKHVYAWEDAINWYCFIGYHATRTQEREEQRIRVSRTNPNVVSRVLFMYTYTHADVNTRRQRSVEIYHPRDWTSRIFTKMSRTLRRVVNWNRRWNLGSPEKNVKKMHICIWIIDGIRLENYASTNLL